MHGLPNLKISIHVESLKQHPMSLWKKLTKSKDYAIKMLSWLKKHRGMCVKQLSHDNELSQDIIYSTKNQSLILL